MSHRFRFLAVVVGLQILVLLGMVVVHESRLRRGAVVLLETVPVDPRDLLRGDYLILSYKIGRVPLALITGPATNNLSAGTPVFVRLRKRGPFHQVDEASLLALAAEEGAPVILGKVSERNEWWNRGGGATNAGVLLDYGLERYYVREGTGNPRGTLTVEAAISTSGTAGIRQVFLDGKPYADAMRQQAP